MIRMIVCVYIEPRWNTVQIFDSEKFPCSEIEQRYASYSKSNNNGKVNNENIILPIIIIIVYEMNANDRVVIDQEVVPSRAPVYDAEKRSIHSTTINLTISPLRLSIVYRYIWEIIIELNVSIFAEHKSQQHSLLTYRRGNGSNNKWSRIRIEIDQAFWLCGQPRRFHPPSPPPTPSRSVSPSFAAVLFYSARPLSFLPCVVCTCCCCGSSPGHQDDDAGPKISKNSWCNNKVMCGMYKNVNWIFIGTTTA